MSIARNFLVEIGPPPVRPDRAVLQIASYPARDDLLGVLQQLGAQRLHARARRLRRPHGRRRPARRCARSSRSRSSGRDDAQLGAILAGPKATVRCSWPPTSSDADDFERCRALGFTYFQGDFFAKPRMVRHRGVGTGGLASLRALGELSAADVSFEDLERIISSDVGLSLKLLRYVNSAFFALPRTIALGPRGAQPARHPHRPPLGDRDGDVRHPGRPARAGRHRPAPRPHVRDARRQRAARGARDALHDRPLLRRGRPHGHAMEEVLEPLPFSDEIRAALLRREGPKGELLSAVVAYERGEFPTLAGGRRRHRLARRRVPLRARVGRRGRPGDRLSRGAGRAPRGPAGSRAARRRAGRKAVLRPRRSAALQRPCIGDRGDAAAPAALRARAQASSVAPVVWTSSTSRAARRRRAVPPAVCPARGAPRGPRAT